MRRVITLVKDVMARRSLESVNALKWRMNHFWYNYALLARSARSYFGKGEEREVDNCSTMPLENADAVPFMITRKMKMELIAKGYNLEDIRNMTPIVAHNILNKSNNNTEQQNKNTNQNPNNKQENTSAVQMDEVQNSKQTLQPEPKTVDDEILMHKETVEKENSKEQVTLALPKPDAKNS